MFKVSIIASYSESGTGRVIGRKNIFRRESDVREVGIKQALAADLRSKIQAQSINKTSALKIEKARKIRIISKT